MFQQFGLALGLLTGGEVFDSGDFQSLCERLKSNDETIDTVSLTSNGTGGGYFINDHDAKELSICLQQNTVVTELYLNITRLSVRGGASLMQFILSSKNLVILGLQAGSTGLADDEDDDDDVNTQVMVVDILARAALQNKANLTLEATNCPIARSTLLACLKSESLLTEIALGSGHCRLILDDEDPILQEQSFSQVLDVVSIIKNGDDGGLSEFLLECSLYLPKLTKMFLDGVKNVPKSLSNSRSLVEFSYMKAIEDRPVDPVPYDSLIEYIGQANCLQQVYLNLPCITQSQTEKICQAFQGNHSLTSVWQNPVISHELQAHCERNRRFLSQWRDMKEKIEPRLFAFAAEIGLKSNLGRTSFYERLPLLLASSNS